MEPERPSGPQERAQSLLDSGQYVSAVEAAKRAALLAPKDPRPHDIAGEALYMLNDFEGAYEEADAALRLDPSDKRAKSISEVAKGRISGMATAAVQVDRKPERTGSDAALFGTALVLGVVLAFLVWRRAARRRGPIDVPTAPRPGPSLWTDSYRLVREIGVGGMGHVYEAVDLHLNRRVAVKRLREEIRSDPHEKERFLTEARLVAALRHPNIVQIHSVVSEGDEAYLVFEYIEGRTMEDYVEHWGRLELPHVLWVCDRVAAALEEAHSRGIVHRDLKPANIMVSGDGAVKVMDFGVARQAKGHLHSMSACSTVVGTPAYMAPEQEEGRASKQSDVFGLAVCIYYMLTGTLPFRGSGGGIVLQKMQKAYAPASHMVPGLPDGVDDVLGWGLEPAPSARCASPLALVSNLRALSPAAQTTVPDFLRRYGWDG